MSIDVMKQALEALEYLQGIVDTERGPKAAAALRTAIEQAEKQEPFGYFQYAMHFDAWVQNRDSNKGVAFYTTPPAAPVQDSNHEFKNFHRVLCERFGYTHDEVDWKRDQISLIEWIAKQVQPAKGKAPQSANCEAPGGISSDHARSADYKANQPVAWMVDVDIANYQGQSEYRTILAWNAKPVWSGTHEINEVLKAIPLYTTPPAAPVQERNFCERCGKRLGDGHIHTCTPPATQQQWVGLTPREIYNLWEDSGVPFVDWDSFASIAQAIEAKLKEKNT